MEKKLAAFDFDHTVVNENSDIVARDLLPCEVINKRLKNLKSSQGWTLYMDEVFQLLFEEGIDIEDLREAIVSIPAVQDIVKLFRDLKTINFDLIIISDSNTFFIEEWLKNKGIREVVHSIYSNPGFISDGRLCIKPYHEQDWCQLSTVNLCKGHILQTHIEGGDKYKKIAYIGDGHNDLCPSLKLREEDIVFPRIGYRLLEELESARKDIKAHVVPWENSEQIWSVLKHI